MSNARLLYTWGDQACGKIGHGCSTHPQVQPKLLPCTFPGGGVKQVACGWQHTLILTNSGVVFGLGGNGKGQLGCGKICLTRLQPCPIVAGSGVRFNHICASSEHSAGISTDGHLFTWGENVDGRLGHKPGEVNYSGTSGSTLAEPSIVRALLDVAVRRVACGVRHMLCLTDEGRLFTCGAGSRGRLGLGHDEGRDSPVPIEALNDLRVVCIACGGGHSVAAADDGRVFSWGANDRGQLGNGTADDGNTPNAMGSYASHGNCSELACGLAHTVLLTGSSVLFACGDNRSGQLGVADAGPVLVGQQVPIPAGCTPVSIACGTAHTIAKVRDATLNNGFVSFGQGSAGQLGTGLTHDSNSAVHTHSPMFMVLSIFAGGKHTAMLVDQQPPSMLPEVVADGYNSEEENWVGGQWTFNDFNAPGWEPQPSRHSQNAGSGGGAVAYHIDHAAGRPKTPDADEGWSGGGAGKA